VILILGGKDKDSDYTTLSPLIRERVKQIVLIGAASDKIEAAISGVKPILRAATMRDAVTELIEGPKKATRFCLLPRVQVSICLTITNIAVECLKKKSSD